MDDALARFHANKSIFIDCSVRVDFNLPKFHTLTHYQPGIEWFGTMDGHATAYTGRLHIDYLKDAYKASNIATRKEGRKEGIFTSNAR